MSDPSIQVNDPLMVIFTIQHDLRARYLNAMEDALMAMASIDDPTIAMDTARGILRFALDEGAIREWMQLGRPMPWIDQKFGPEADALTAAVIEMMDRIEEANNG